MASILNTYVLDDLSPAGLASAEVQRYWPT